MPTTDLAELDRALAGDLRPQSPTLLAGSPGTGKTRLAKTIARAASREYQQRVAYLATFPEGDLGAVDGIITTQYVEDLCLQELPISVRPLQARELTVAVSS